MSGSTLFGLIRHAPTRWNEERKIQGQADSPLSEQGRALASGWGGELASLAWQRIVCSDLGRVRETVRLLKNRLALPVTEDSRLREQDWGTWTAMTLHQLKQREENILREQERQGWDFHPPGGESRREVLARVLAALRDAHRAGGAERILLVCHEGVIKCLLYHLLGRKFLPEEPPVLKPFHLHLAVMEGDVLRLESLNHLPLSGAPKGGGG
ncbi:MAG: hypothetical protein Kow0089_13870 [Desulfobulbaceae bacterium]